MTSKLPERNMEQAIRAAAEELFLERGYARTSTVEIARQAGCNQTLVHYYFRSKEQLFLAIFSEKVAGFARRLFDVDVYQLPFDQIIARIVEAHFEILEANPRLPFFILDELMHSPDRLEALRRSVLENLDLSTIRRLEGILRQEIEAGRVREMTLFELAMTMGSLNVMPFIVRPVVLNAFSMSEEAYAALLRRRRAMNIEIVLRSLKP